MLFRVSAVVLLLIAGCSSSEATPQTPDSGVTDSGTHDAAKDAAAKPDSAPALTGAEAWCATLKTKQLRCDKEQQCGADFDSWCAKQATTNSKAFESADTDCVNSSCSVSDRSACRYKKYAGIGMSALQQALAESYCSTCTAVPSCLSATTNYTSVDEVSDAFLAVWEFSDAMVSEIKQKCTGSALKIVKDNCPKSFSDCASDIYFSALPDCP